MILSFFNRRTARHDPSDTAAGQEATRRLGLIRDYWTALCPDRGTGSALPRRADLSPRGIDTALSQAFLIERMAPGLAKFRIAGMDLNDLMGMDVRGMPFSCLLAPAARADFGQVLEQVLSGQSLLEAELEAEREARRPALRGLLLILPLAVEPDGRRMAFGGFAPVGAVGLAPRRFHVARQQLLATPTLTVEQSPTPAFAETAVLFRPAPDARPAKPYLRLVK